MRFEVEEAAERFESLVYLATHGEDIVLTQYGRPVARLVPFDADSAYVRDWSSSRRRPSRALVATALVAALAITAALWCQWQRRVRR